MQPYRPSNGTEGAYFQEARCGSCVKEPTCKIARLIMVHGLDIDDIVADLTGWRG